MPDAISDDLARAFFRAVERYQLEWTPSIPELKVDFEGKSFSMTEVCGLVESFADPLPAPLFDMLLYCMDMSRADLRGKLAADRTYGTAAYCLREIIRRRQEDYRLKEKLRG